MYLDEQTPTSLERQIANTRRAFLSKIAAKQVPDRPINLRRKVEKVETCEKQTTETSYYPSYFWNLLCEWNINIPSIISNTNPVTPSYHIPIESVFKVKEIQRAVCEAYNVHFNDMISSRRTGSIVEPRHIAIMLCKHLTKLSMPEIGRMFGGKDHTTILHAVRKLSPILPEIIRTVPNGSSALEWAVVSMNVFVRSRLKKKSIYA